MKHVSRGITDAYKAKKCERVAREIPKQSDHHRAESWKQLLRLHPASRRWVKWWRNPNIEKLLCHVSAGKTLEEWVSGVQDSYAVEASRRTGKMKKQPLAHVYRDRFQEDCLCTTQRLNVARYAWGVASRFLNIATREEQKPQTAARYNYNNDGRWPNPQISYNPRAAQHPHHLCVR